jgi:hypothetical protein
MPFFERIEKVCGADYIQKKALKNKELLLPLKGEFIIVCSVFMSSFCARNMATSSGAVVVDPCLR